MGAYGGEALVLGVRNRLGMWYCMNSPGSELWGHMVRGEAGREAVGLQFWQWLCYPSYYGEYTGSHQIPEVKHH